MNNIMRFEDKQVEVLEFKGQALFNPYNVGECLGLTESAVRKAVSNMSNKQVIKLKNLDVKESNIRKLNNAGENFLTESGVYKLIFRSNKPSAEKFTNWVTDEVLPSIRKHGMYAKDELLDNPDLLIQVATELKKEKEEKKLLQQQNTQQKKQLEEQKPKVIFADSVQASKTSILVGDLAKIIKQNGIDMGAKRLFIWLRNKGYLIKRKGMDYNMPTQKSMELKLFEVKETSITHSDGHISISKTPKITGKGQVYFINKFKGIM
ncbi:phage antirepressor KilAC domain-containing protein [Clostridium rectalis]|uniref:phage antirepressor KilAC domain-containing protein n=1 Tax=Clostridium rectalis TaxID=2040295 RepID=UPI000F630EE0|nr:phage antirepressor KilAC domain-containing protein [Clostridium rectalis]